MSEQPATDNRPTTDPPLEPAAQPVAGGDDDSAPAQGEGAEDSH